VTARRTRSGAWRPAAVNYLDGLVEVRRLREEEGLDVNMTTDEITALGRAMADQREAQAPAMGQVQNLTLSEEASRILDQIVAERSRPIGQAQDQHLDQASAQGRGTGTPERIEFGFSRPHDTGQGDRQRREVQKGQVRNGKNDRSV
jgi:hypothetical protein